MDNISSMSDETLLTNYTKLKVEIDKRKEAAKAFLDQYDDITKPKVLLNLPSLDITDIQYYILTKIAYCIFKDVVETQTSCHVEHLWENRVRVVFRDPKDKQKLKNALQMYFSTWKALKPRRDARSTAMIGNFLLGLVSMASFVLRDMSLSTLILTLN